MAMTFAGSEAAITSERENLNTLINKNINKDRMKEMAA